MSFRITCYLRRLRISHKLILISLSLLLPIAVLLYFMVAGINYDIRFTQLELYGNEYQRPLEELLRAIPRHEFLSHQVLAGDTQLENAVATEASTIDQALKKLDAVNRQYGEDLQFTQEGLGKRQRLSANPNDLTAAWEELRQNWKTLSPSENDVQHNRLRSTVRTMISHSGDTSNLILDPDLDSYYLMDITLLALPQTQDRLADIAADGIRILSKPMRTTDDSLKLAVFASLLKQSDFDRIVQSTRTALNEDPNFYGVSDSIGNVDQALNRYVEQTQDFLAVLNKAAQIENAITADDFDQSARRALDASFNLWNEASTELDKLLNTRMKHYESNRQWSLALTLLALLVSAVLIYVVARSITTSLKQCVIGLHALARKDLGYQLEVSTGGELGEISTAVNQAAGGMLEAIKCYNIL